MAQPTNLEGTAQELDAYLAQNPKGRFRSISLSPESELTVTSEESVDAKLRQWQEQEGISLMPDVSASVLFALWAKEDAQMTKSEREAEDQLWQDIEQSLLGGENRLQLRRPGS